MPDKLHVMTMRRRSVRTILLAVALTASGYLAQPLAAQEANKVIVPLQISSPYGQSVAVAKVEFDQRGPGTTEKKKIGSIRLGKLPGGLPVAVETIAESPAAYRVKVDTNGDKDLSDESAMLLNLNSSLTMNIARKRANGTTVILPYMLSYEQDTSGQQVEEMFYWRPRYAAGGKLAIGNCHADVKVLDANGDGVFDRTDFHHMTTIYIDDGKAGSVINLNDPRVIKHSDGTYQIPSELRRAAKRKWLRGEEIIELCGNSYLVD